MLTLLTHKLYMCYLLLLASGTIFDFFFMRDTFQSHNYQPFWAYNNNWNIFLSPQMHALSKQILPIVALQGYVRWLASAVEHLGSKVILLQYAFCSPSLVRPCKSTLRHEWHIRLDSKWLLTFQHFVVVVANVRHNLATSWERAAKDKSSQIRIDRNKTWKLIEQTGAVRESSERKGKRKIQVDQCQFPESVSNLTT